MATLYVKDVPDDVYKALQARAKANGRSLSAEVRKVLEELPSPAKRSRAEVLASIEARRKRIAAEGRGLSNEEIVALIREDRDR